MWSDNCHDKCTLSLAASEFSIKILYCSLSGIFVFVTFQDGYTARIFKTCDILKGDDAPIGSFKDLRPGEEVLARWSDKKFYKATVQYVSLDHKKNDARKGTTMHGVAAHRLYNPPPVLPEVQHISGQPQPVTVPFSNPSPFAQCPNQPLFAQPPIQPPFAFSHHQPPFPQPMSSDQSQGQPVLIDLDVQWNQTIPHNPTPKESFLGMLLPPSVFERPTQIPSFTADTVDVDDEVLTTSPSSLADTVILDRSPLTEYGEGSSGSSEERPWEPCRACKTEVAKLMKETGRMKDVLSSIGKLI